VVSAIKVTVPSVASPAVVVKIPGIQGPPGSSGSGGGGAVSSVAGRTGAVTLTKSDVGLSNADNTSDANKPVSTAQATAISAKADDAATTAALATKAPLASPAFTGAPTGITKAHVGLGNVDNTSDANKPVSTAQATADSAVQTAAATDATTKANAAQAAAIQRANHTGTQSADTLVEGTNTKIFTSAERTKLSGVATGATANDTDANLKNRANHTGTQLASTISDFNAAALAASGSQVFKTTSTTSRTLSGSSTTFTITPATNLVVGMIVMVTTTDEPIIWMSGTITAISPTSITILPLTFSNPLGDVASNWTIVLAGRAGLQGETGLTGAPGTSQTFAEHFDFGFSGTLTVRTGLLYQVSPNAACTIKEILLVAGTQPVGANIIVDVKNNGSTIFASSGLRPFIAPGSPYAYGNGTGLNIALAARSRLSVDITQIGSSTPGTDLTVQVVYTRN